MRRGVCRKLYSVEKEAKTQNLFAEEWATLLMENQDGCLKLLKHSLLKNRPSLFPSPCCAMDRSDMDAVLDRGFFKRLFFADRRRAGESPPYACYGKICHSEKPSVIFLLEGFLRISPAIPTSPVAIINIVAGSGTGVSGLASTFIPTFLTIKSL